MAMKPALTLKLGQQLRMTPQLQHAIRLLQLSSLDLQQEIQEALDSNLMLEEVSTSDDQESVEPTSLDPPDDNFTDAEDAAYDTNTADAGTDAEATDLAEEPPPPDPEIDGDAIPDTLEQISTETMGTGTAETVADDLPVDSVWEDVFDEAPLPASYTAPSESDDDYLDNRNTVEVSLQSHLMEQVSLLSLSDLDQIIAFTILDGLDTNGVLTITCEDILESIPEEYEAEADEVEAVLHLIQHLDPLGVAARDLRECLLIQLKHLPDKTPWRREAIEVANHYLSSLANRDYAFLLRKTRLKEPELKQCVALITSLDPRPGADFSTNETEYIDPEVIVTKQNNRWVVELNPKSAPKIRVNTEYQGLIRRADNSNDNNYLKGHLQEARWFIKSLQQRNDTLLKVATKIVEYQRGFLEYGEQAMKPLVLHDIAKAVDLHESTISRVTTQKYMHTPLGVFELKYFFSSHVSTHTGGEVSSTAIRALIKELIADESQKKPLSDSKIAKLLAEQDIKVARRTVAKYRESMMIPPSNERKQLV
jgi:RNA polymerase sigma-54 factor